MRIWSQLRSWMHAVTRRSRMEREMDAELRFHIEAFAEDLVRGGVPRQEALRRARIEFGGVERAKEACREARGASFIDNFLHDLRFGLRMLRKNPGFTFVAVLTLALGIGASTAVFSLVNAILLRPLPFPHSERIVLPLLVSPPGVNLGGEYFPWHPLQFFLVRQEQNAFQALGAFENDSFSLTGSGDPVLLDGFRVSVGFFPALGISPILGRAFTPEEDSPGHELEVIVSHQLWQERFGGETSIVGRSLELNGHEYAVVGVMPAGFVFPRAEEMPSSFNFPREAQLWVPLAVPADFKGPSELALIGRLNSGFTLQQAQAQLDAVTKHAQEKDPRWKGWFNTRIVPLSRQIVGDTRGPLLLILGAVGVVLLIACSNVANLLLNRALTRQKEFVLRTALGAGRSRLIRQLLTESLLLSLSAALAGALFAKLAVHFVKVFGPANLPRLREVSLDLRVFAFALAIALVTGIFFGLAPALAAARVNLCEALREGSQRTGAGPTNSRMRNALLISQVALAFVLVVSASLLLRSFFLLLHADGGFNPERVLTFQLSLPATRYGDTVNVVSFYRKALDKLRTLPGVQSAGLGETVPMGGEGESTVIRLPDHPPSNDKELPFANYTIISPGYLSAVGTPVLRGRDFQEFDTLDSLPVTLINQAMARKYWHGQNPLGKQVGVGSTRYPLTTIVGIVADAKHISLREESVPEMYVPYTQKVWPSMLNLRIALRTYADPSAMTASVREVIQSIDPQLPLAKVATLTTLVAESVAQPRFAMLLLAAFALMALLLACIGMYGVISYSVTQRTREIGVRIALGAARHDVSGMVLRQGAVLAGIGVGIGLIAALGVSRLIAGFLYGIAANDPLTYAAVSILLIAIVLLACCFPARRALRVDPMVALRHE